METTNETGTGKTPQKKVITQINNDKKSAKKPPPLVMHGEITHHNQLVNRTKDIVTGKFFVKYHIGFTEVFTACDSDYQLLKNAWKNNQIPFHTYTTKYEQRRTYILKGLHGKVDTKEILKELIEIGLPAFNMNQTKMLVIWDIQK